MTNSLKLPEFYSLKKVHIIGVGGTLMGAFAAFLKHQGIHVTGSDLTLYPPMSDVLKNAGVQVYTGYHAENLKADSIHPDLVIIGNVIRRDNPEAQEAMSGKYLYSSLPEAMEKLLLRETTNLVVAGTHGKTTTSSLLAFVLEQCQKHPSYFIGGVSQDLPQSFFLSESHQKARPSLFVLEGDEYDTAFWDKVPKFNHYLPDHAILTSIEYDHADIYPDMNAVVRAFEGLFARVRKGGHVIACFDYEEVRRLSAQAQIPILSYASHSGTQARFTPQRVRVLNDGLTHFDVMDAGEKVDELAIQLSGVHNVLNALAVWIECKSLGLDPDQLRVSLRRFQGVKRRQEVRAVIDGIIVIDDFAHHPTAVRETLKALKLKYPTSRLLAVFEPRSATSRRKVFQKDYANAFQHADQIWIASPFDQSRISLDEQFSSDQLVSDLNGLGKSAHLLTSVDAGVKDVANAACSGDLIAVLSNGGFDGFIPKLIGQLQSHH